MDPDGRRTELRPEVQVLAATIGITTAYQALGVSRSGFYRHQESLPSPRSEPRPAAASRRGLSPDEKAQVCEVLDSEHFQDCPPREARSVPPCWMKEPNSEAQFKTMKYRPDYPDRFGCLADARACAGVLHLVQSGAQSHRSSPADPVCRAS